MKKKIMSVIMIITFVLLTAGCGNKTDKTDNYEENSKVDDVVIRQHNSMYYYCDKNGNKQSTKEAIVILGFNDYQCVYTNIEYDENTEKYICTVEFKKIIKNNEE